MAQQNGNPSALVQETPTPQSVPPDSEVKYFFLAGFLAGSWQDGTWHSFNSPEKGTAENTPYLIKDILAQKKYKLFNTKSEAGVTTTLDWFVGMGLGGLESNMTETLAPYSQPKDDNEEFREFALPTNLGEECANITVPSYAFYTDFGCNDVVLATNATHNLQPRKMVRGETLNKLR